MLHGTATTHAEMWTAWLDTRSRLAVNHLEARDFIGRLGSHRTRTHLFSGQRTFYKNNLSIPTRYTAGFEIQRFN
jgi:hypothetical protein